jgi:CBS domain containing-hemolysin-like protein
MHSFFVFLVIIALSALLSAFFSAAETALFSLKKSDLHRFSCSKPGTVENRLSHAMSEPQKILITILIGNLFVNMVMANLSASLLLEKWPYYGHLISTAILTPAVILFCEISPKIIAINRYESLSRRFYPLLMFFHWIFSPIRILLLVITNSIIRLFNLKVSQNQLTEAELGHAVLRSEEDGIIDRDEGEFLQNILRFSKKEASNIMFPRNRALFIDHEAGVEEAMELLLKNDVVRAPVYEKDNDHVIGYIDSKDLTPYYMGTRSLKTIRKLVHPIDFYPSSRQLHDLLNDFIEHRSQIAILVDEYGGVDGVVTLNRILAELMGKGFTKWEVDSRKGIRKLSASVSVVSGDMQTSDYNFSFDDNIESSEADTLGGYIIEKLGHFPRKGESIRTEKFELKVRYVVRNRVDSIEVTRLEG